MVPAQQRRHARQIAGVIAQIRTEPAQRLDGRMNQEKLEPIALEAVGCCTEALAAARLGQLDTLTQVVLPMMNTIAMATFRRLSRRSTRNTV